MSKFFEISELKIYDDMGMNISKAFQVEPFDFEDTDILIQKEWGHKANKDMIIPPYIFYSNHNLLLRYGSRLFTASLENLKERTWLSFSPLLFKTLNGYCNSLLSRVINIKLMQKDMMKIHASSFSIGESNVLVVGWTHSGKSTTARLSAEDGNKVFTDDTVILRDDGSIVPMPRNIKSYRRSALSFLDTVPLINRYTTKYDITKIDFDTSPKKIDAVFYLKKNTTENKKEPQWMEAHDCWRMLQESSRYKHKLTDEKNVISSYCHLTDFPLFEMQNFVERTTLKSFTSKPSYMIEGRNPKESYELIKQKVNEI